MEEKLLSIILPVYGVEKYIGECLESIRVQLTDDCEVIMMDDGSKDNSYLTCLEYEKMDNRFHYYKKENGGLSDARNKAVPLAKGKYIYFVDSDDYIVSDALENILEALKKDPDCIVFDVLYFWEDSDQKKVVPGIYPIGEGIFSNLLSAAPSAWNKVFKKETYLKYPYPYQKYYEDIATTPKLLTECSDIIYINKPLYCYRQREGSIIHSYNQKCFDIFEDLEGIFEFYKEKGLFEKYYEVLEYLDIEHVLLHSNRRFIHMDKPKEYLQMSKDFTDKFFKDCLKNQYYKKMSLNDRVFIYLAYHINVTAIKAILGLKNLISK